MCVKAEMRIEELEYQLQLIGALVHDRFPGHPQTTGGAVSDVKFLLNELEAYTGPGPVESRQSLVFTDSDNDTVDIVYVSGD